MKHPYHHPIGYDPAHDQAEAAWESARQAKRSATIALWALAAGVIAALVASTVPLVGEELRERAAYNAALDDELDRAQSWVIAGIQVEDDLLSVQVASDLKAGQIMPRGRDAVLAYQWQHRLLAARQRLETLATQSAQPHDLQQLRKVEAFQIDEVQSFVDAARSEATPSDQNGATEMLNITSGGLAQLINKIEIGRGQTPPFDSDQWPLVDVATAARNAMAKLRKLHPDAPQKLMRKQSNASKPGEGDR